MKGGRRKHWNDAEGHFFCHSIPFVLIRAVSRSLRHTATIARWILIAQAFNPSSTSRRRDVLSPRQSAFNNDGTPLSCCFSLTLMVAIVTVIAEDSEPLIFNLLLVWQFLHKWGCSRPSPVSRCYRSSDRSSFQGETGSTGAITGCVGHRLTTRRVNQTVKCHNFLVGHRSWPVYDKIGY